MGQVRNVLFVTVDQWRGDTLSAVGHPLVRTPTLDGLAAEGVLFANHWANSTPCGPSRATIHTGMYQFNHRSVLNGTPLDSRHRTLADEVRDHGLTPWLFGYTDTSVDPRTVSPNDPRLRTYESVAHGYSSEVDITEFDPPWVRFLTREGYTIPADYWDLYAPVSGYPGADSHGATWAPTQFPPEHTETWFLTDRVIDHLRAVGGEPWFVHVSYLRPHPPYRAPAPYHDRYPADDVPPPVRCATREEEAARHPLLAGALATPAAAAPTDDRDTLQLRATYYGLMAEVDDNLGRLFGWLREQGLWEDTLVVLGSDHGEEAGDHYLVQKLGFFDESYHVPLIVRDPRPEADVSRGTQVQAFTENVDVMPTILDALGPGPMPLQCDGRSLLPFTRGETPEEWRTEAFFEFDFRMPWLAKASDEPFSPGGPLGMRMQDCALNVIRGADFKYVHFPTLPPLFFDLADDPGELHDRSGEPEAVPRMLDAAQRLVTRRMRNDERTLTGTFLAADGPIVVDDRLR